VTVAGGTDQTVTLHVRKPIAFFGSTGLLDPKMLMTDALPGPDPLMLLDTTLPAIASLPSVTLPMGAQALATAATGDGRYVLVGIAGGIAVIDTLDLSVAAQAALSPSSAVPRAIAVAPDDSAAVVVTDQGVAMTPIAALATGQAATVMLLPLTGARAAAWHRDGSAATVLTGPSWDALDCMNPDPASTYELHVPGTALSAATDAPAGTTDVAWDSTGQMLLAVPCGAGVLGNGGATVLAGSGIHRVLVAGGRLIAVPSAVEQVQSAFDPEDPARMGPVRLPYGGIVVVSGGQPQEVRFPLPQDRITLTDQADGSLVEARLTPSEIVVYDAALSPDLGHLLIASRQRSQTQALRYIDVVDQNDASIFYCTLDASEEVYRVTEVDLDAGTVGYQETRGEVRQSCIDQCFDCLVCEPCFTCPTGVDCHAGPCQLSQEEDCRVAEGFVPGGLSVLLGYR
jgi:hypothetical protein